LFLSLNAEAETKKTLAPGNLFSLTATAGGYLFAGTDHLEAAPIYGLKLGYDILGQSLADSLGIEATFNYLNTESTIDSSIIEGGLIRIDATYPFIPRGKVVPLIAVGAGTIYLNKSPSKFKPLFNYGPSVKYFLNDYLALRLDLRHLLVYSDAHTRNNFEFTTGFSYIFGKEKKKKP
jgi:OOP family OmpA-OmpF porin